MRNFGLALMLAAVGAAPVAAGGTGWSWNWTNACGGNNFITCMSGTIAYAGSGNSLQVTVRNDAPYAGDTYRAVGLFNLPAGLTPTITANDLSNWSANAPNYPGIEGPLTPEEYAIAADQGNKAFGEDGIYHSFTFTFSNLSVAQLMAWETIVGVGVHATRGPNGCSTKMGVTNPNGDATGEAVDNFNAVTAAAEGCISVPEPETAGLMLMGILGLGFVAAYRLRREA